MTDPAKQSGDPPVPESLPLPDVDSPPVEDVLENAPSTEEIIEQAESAEEIVRQQPDVDELLRRDR